MIEAFRSTPIGFLVGVATSAVVASWLAPSTPAVSIAPAHQVPGQTTGLLREAGVREAIGRVEDSLERCCAVHTVEIPAPVCKCGLGDTLGDLLQGFVLGAGSFVVAIIAWASRCCAFIGRALLPAGRPASRAAAESQPAAVGPGSPQTYSFESEAASAAPAKRRAGRGGALAHLAIESSQLD